MAFDQSTRNKLQHFVADARTLLADEFTRQLQHEYGLDPVNGTVSSLDKLTHLDDARLETARLLRDSLEHYQAASPSGGITGSLDRIVREQAFTVLNRLCALRMAEARGILIESIGHGYQSKGFQLYHRIAGSGLGETGEAYRSYLFSVFDELALDLAVLFDRFSPMGRLFPRETVLLELLNKVNATEIAALWSEDETIGWIYQYFNSVEERRQMRAESQAPRNSRELAVRNQFFTPRYVVEFLTDNTLGRIWYEMTQGQTSLKDSCAYLVRRPHEVFLAKGESAPLTEENEEELSQEELLQQVVYIPYRPLKDPRDILMLDPACGSMHFGLYAYDLYERIYLEAWQWEVQHGVDTLLRSEALQPLHTTFADETAFRRQIPRLIIEHNIHGVDIDPRATQIAGLSLWLRAQRSWKEQQLKPQERPRIQKSNIVCAEPMPGEKDLLREFAASLKPRVLGQLLEIIFEKMELAGEAGSLLKIEEEIELAVEKARNEFGEELKRRRDGRQEVLFEEFRQPEQLGLFDFTDLPTKTRFWEDAEQKILQSLQAYAEQTELSGSSRKRLFAQDAAKGFAFIDLCRKRFDLTLMNPPFGKSSNKSTKYINEGYKEGKFDLASAFIDRMLGLLNETGTCGQLTARAPFYTKYHSKWRINILRNKRISTFVDLGTGVLDNAWIEVCATCITNNSSSQYYFTDANELQIKKKIRKLSSADEEIGEGVYIQDKDFPIYVPEYQFNYLFERKFFDSYSKFPALNRTFDGPKPGASTGTTERFVRLWVENPRNKRKDWVPLAKGGEYGFIFPDIHLEINWKNNGDELKAFHSQDRFERYGDGNWRARLNSYDDYFRPGVYYSRRSSKGLSIRCLPEGCIFSEKSPKISSDDLDHLLLFSIISATNHFQTYVNAHCALGSYEIGAIGRIPLFDFKASSEIDSLILDVKILFDLLVKFDCSNELSRYFKSVPLSDNVFNTINDKFDLIDQIEKMWNFSFCKISIITEKQYRFQSKSPIDQENNIKIYFNNIPDSISRESAVVDYFQDCFSYVTGIIFGRWNIKYSLEESNNDLVDPFESLSVCPPGILQNEKGLPVEPSEISKDYPVEISWKGIIPEDYGNSKDIIAQIRRIIEEIKGERSGEFEQEACEILGIKSLRDYFTNPNKFFDDHLKRYSKSRRQAPIYWMLSTPTGSYTLWLYYHRLSDQTLYTCVNDFVEPKLVEIRQNLADLRRQSSRDQEEEKDLERLTDLELELQDFRDELLHVAHFWKPNLNDGVQITAAPLWKVTPHRAWRKTLQETWKKLEKGEYDWAHLAYSIWPERVLRTAQKDRSIAIAHDLEEALWEEVEVKDAKGKVKMEWRAKKLNEIEIEHIIKNP